MRQAFLEGYTGNMAELINSQMNPQQPQDVPEVPQEPFQMPSMHVSPIQQPSPTLVRSYEPTEPGIKELRHDTKATVLTDPSQYATGGYAKKASDYLYKYLRKK